MELKPSSSSSIQYILIQKDFGVQNIVQYPLNNSNNVFSILPYFPRDLMQFHDQQLFFETSKRIIQINPALNLLSFTDKQLTNDLSPIYAYSDLLNLKNRVVVYLIDAEADIELIKKCILTSGQKIWYYTYCGKAKQHPEIFHQEHYFSFPNRLVELLQRDFDKIKSTLSKITEGSKELEFNIDSKENKDGVYNFTPIVPNYFTNSQIENHPWKLNYPTPLPTPKSTIRNKILLDSVKKIDEKHIAFAEKHGLVNTIPILVISFPFYEPSILETYKNNAETKREKALAKVFSIEQSTDYQNYFEAKNDDEGELAKIAIEEILKPKLKLLDGVMYLQSSFTFSPVMRFPIVGKSLYKELSFFNPKNNFFNTPKSRKNRINSILKFGDKLKKLTVSDETEDYLINRQGQILAISDLPVEWLGLKSIPLSFTHDVCRIQESNYQGNFNNYSANNRFDFNVNKSTIKKTLIILSADVDDKKDHEFKASYQAVIHASKTSEFNYEYCETIEQIAQAIKKYQPEFLIFDCHGNIDKEKETSYLVINGEKLYGDDIVKYNISAPIVFLSCCNSNPNYGYIHKIHDAFFQAGALTVTGTFLPISVQRGTIYYLRLLNLLKMELTKRLHKNWLSFVSQVIRSSFMHDAYIKAITKLGRNLTKEEKENLSKVMLETHIFSKRREIFARFLNEGVKLSEELTFNFEDTESEFLLYSHYGRPDLIRISKQ